MDKVGTKKDVAPGGRASPAPSSKQAMPRQAPAAAPASATPAAPVAPTAPANAPAAQTGVRPRFPYGWLVIVEGPGTGDWYPLERGVSHIGSGAGQTVRLEHGDDAVHAEGHAVLNYDEAHHRFVLSCPEGARLRVNGVQSDAPTGLRDGDVITVGGTALRLVALCSQNFHWSKDLQRS
ncbi:FHA domain-containing protein [Alphaproteobacteria bacterium GH1-50]|uniref:FHA domain-containing protein n=1 Tax=Kangsaoukella pontilimi TaxID=2691042 RepID=A0A7C9MPY6_9RHOB|nr:FHA domain-containing protein [Kangsaoukella pontilimi]MXQ06877.1 FHA domain-containing protein [Kangsaoukella pontilimi]